MSSAYERCMSSSKVSFSTENTRPGADGAELGEESTHAREEGGDLRLGLVPPGLEVEVVVHLAIAALLHALLRILPCNIVVENRQKLKTAN